MGWERVIDETYKATVNESKVVCVDGPKESFAYWAIYQPWKVHFLGWWSITMGRQSCSARPCRMKRHEHCLNSMRLTSLRSTSVRGGLADLAIAKSSQSDSQASQSVRLNF
jgi:hypothetical protein